MNFERHDINSSGFYTHPELLSHDLALLKVQLSESFKPGMDGTALYELYINELASTRAIIDDRTRYDSSIK